MCTYVIKLYSLKHISHTPCIGSGYLPTLQHFKSESGTQFDISAGILYRITLAVTSLNLSTGPPNTKGAT